MQPFTDVFKSLVSKFNKSPDNDGFSYSSIAYIKQIIKDIKMGKSRASALKDAYRKTDIWDLKTIYMTIIQAETLGCAIGKSLRNQIETMRKARMNQAERNAQKAPLKLMIPLLFFIFPVTFAVLSAPIIIRFVQGSFI